MSKWHEPITPCEYLLKTDPCETWIRAVHSPMREIEKIIDADATKASKEYLEMFYDLLLQIRFNKLQRPTYLVSREMFEVLMAIEISQQDIENSFEHLPYDCFCVSFERGCKIANNELNNIFACRGEKEALHFRANDHQFGVIATPTAMKDLSSKRDSDELDHLAILFSKLVLLWRARPEYISDYIPQGFMERRQFRGNRSLLRMWKFPDILKVKLTNAMTGAGTNRAIKPHWRAGHFRHYRHERYERNLDGSVKVEFIEPCFIGLKTDAT